MNYIAYIGEAEQGPYTFEDLEMCEQVGDITDQTYIRRDNHDIWRFWSDIKKERAAIVERKQLFEASQRPGMGAGFRPNTLNAAAPSIAPIGPSTRSRITYVVLGLFLGCLGIHNFYAGYSGRAIAQLLITLAVGWLIFPLAVVGIWVLIELVAVEEDAEGARFR